MTAPPIDACSPTSAELHGRTVLTFGGCNYLGLAQHPRVIAAVTDALSRFGLSTSASRETTGNTAVHAELERLATEFCGHAAGLLVPDGYIANLTAMQALAKLGVREAVIDQRAHPSLRDAAHLAGMHTRVFHHLDAEHARSVLHSCNGPAVVLTDSVFAADGSIAPAGHHYSSLRSVDRLLLDDCHGFGVLGRGGRGLADHLALPTEQLVVTTTLAKGLGCAGGMVMGEPALINLARTHATAYICTTPCSPALAAGAIEALRLLRDDAGLTDTLHRNTRSLRAGLAAHFAVDPDHPIPIVAFHTSSAEQMRAMHRHALDQGILAPLVEYPGGPAPIYFRLSVTARHTDDQIEQLTRVLTAARHQATGAAR